MPADARRFTRRAGAGGALASFGLLLAACGGGDEDEDTTAGSEDADPAAGVSKKDRDADIEVLNFALTLEVLEATFYQEALRQVGGLSGELQALTEEIESNESEHVTGLTEAIESLGGKPVKAPELDFGNAFASTDSYLELAQTLEDTGVSAYNGAAPEIQSEEVLSTAGSIVQIEARHASLIRLQRGEEPAPNAFDETLTQDEVLDAVAPFIVKSGGGG